MSTTIRQRAIAAAHIADADPELSRTLREGVEHKEKAKQTVHVNYLQLYRVYGYDRLITYPKPGTEGGNNPDKYEDVDTNGKKITSTFCNDFADNTEEGQRIATAIRNFTADASLADPDKEEKVALWTQRRNNHRATVKGCLTLFHQWQDVKGAFPNVGLGFKMKPKLIKGEDGNPDKTVMIYDMDTTKPISVTDKTPKAEGDESPQKYKYVSIGEFINFKLKVALINAATQGEWKSLVASGKKGKKKGGKGGKEAGALLAHITTVDKAVEYMSELAAWMGNVDKGDTGKDSGYGKIMNRLSNLPKGDERKLFVMTLGKLIYGLDGVSAQIDGEYQTYVAEQNRIQAAEATAKQANAA